MYEALYDWPPNGKLVTLRVLVSDAPETNLHFGRTFAPVTPTQFVEAFEIVPGLPSVPRYRVDQSWDETAGRKSSARHIRPRTRTPLLAHKFIHLFLAQIVETTTDTAIRVTMTHV
eukprot:GHVU01021440.1.p2 GENE.GHVU01021440.1~~GHVU01021440.1.p2  ORF type:complete len:116 (+),score=3.75 GHVU01021440.1:299-646(+)